MSRYKALCVAIELCESARKLFSESSEKNRVNEVIKELQDVAKDVRYGGEWQGDYESVAESLISCTENKCGQCAYRKLRESYDYKCIEELKKDAAAAIRVMEKKLKEMRDALTVLTEKKPRLLMLEELKQSVGCPCWFESHGTYMGEKGFWIIPDSFTGYTMRYVFSIPHKPMDHTESTRSGLGLATYNKTWRCWKEMPTEEQRKEEKWEE